MCLPGADSRLTARPDWGALGKGAAVIAGAGSPEAAGNGEAPGADEGVGNPPS